MVTWKLCLCLSRSCTFWEFTCTCRQYGFWKLLFTMVLNSKSYKFTNVRTRTGYLTAAHCLLIAVHSCANFSTTDCVSTGEGTLMFRLINMRADYSFGFFKGDVTIVCNFDFLRAHFEIAKTGHIHGLEFSKTLHIHNLLFMLVSLIFKSFCSSIWMHC